MSSQPDYAPAGSATPDYDGPADAELISAVRAGDIEAYGTLFARHVESARRLARQLVSAGDVDDLVSESFSRVLGVLQRGGGPDLAFRAYLLTSLRRLHVDKLRAGSRLTTTDDLTPYDPGVPFQDTAVSGFENATAAKAFASLPERWQQVLWHTEVEGQKPADIAPLLGMSANSVSALAYRAREGLRQAFITMHANDAADDVCATVRGELGSYIRGGTSRRTSTKIEEHLSDCRECTAIYLELTEVNSHLGAILAPALLGTVGAGYLAASHGLAAKGFLVGLSRAKDWAFGNPAGAAVGAGVAAAGIAATVAIAATGTGSHAPSIAALPPSVPSSSAPAHIPTFSPRPTQSASSAPAVTTPARVIAPIVAPTQAPTSTPSTTPRSTPAGPVIVSPPPSVTVSPSGTVLIDLFAGVRAPNDGLHILNVTADHGTATVSVASHRATAYARQSSGSVLYTPDAGWKGEDTVRYTIADANGRPVSGTAKVTTLDSPPTAPAISAHADASWTTPSAATIAVLPSVTDANGDPVSLVSLGNASHGTVSLDNGAAVYTPAAGYGSVPGSTATDSFAYTVSDGTLETSGTVTVTLGDLPVPQASDDAASLPSSAPITIDVLSNDADPSGAGPVVASQGSHGTATVTDDKIVYTPSGSPADDSFTYSITDAKGQSSTATVTVTAPLPVAQPALTADTHDYGSYQHLRVKLHGLAAGLTSTVTITLQGFGSWDLGGANDSVCPVPTSSSSGTMTITCTYSSKNPGEQELLHFDFIPSGTWSYAVDVTGTDYQGTAAVSGP